MTVRQQWFVVAGVVAALGVGLSIAVRTMGDDLAPVMIGSRAPEFRAVTLDSTPEARTLADYRGHVVLLNIWATWCGPCKAEMPTIEQLHKDFRARGVRVVAVSVDAPGKERDVRQYAHDMGLTFEVLYAPDREIERVYQTTGVPETFLIGKDGVILKRMAGAHDWNSPENRTLFSQLAAAP